MKTLLFTAALAISGTAMATETVQLACTGSNAILDQLQSIAWTQERITLAGTKNGVPYSVDGTFETAYRGNGFAYTTPYGEVVIPFTLINGARQSATVELSNGEFPHETANCSRL